MSSVDASDAICCYRYCLRMRVRRRPRQRRCRHARLPRCRRCRHAPDAEGRRHIVEASHEVTTQRYAAGSGSRYVSSSRYARCDALRAICAVAAMPALQRDARRAASSRARCCEDAAYAAQHAASQQHEPARQRKRGSRRRAPSAPAIVPGAASPRENTADGRIWIDQRLPEHIHTNTRAGMQPASTTTEPTTQRREAVAAARGAAPTAMPSCAAQSAQSAMKIGKRFFERARYAMRERYGCYFLLSMRAAPRCRRHRDASISSTSRRQVPQPIAVYLSL